jgi:hypothetical protein
MTGFRGRRFLLLALALLTAPVAGAQIPERAENLQVYPKDTPRDTLVQRMREISMALGVRCTHCHVGTEGPGGQMRFASDEKPAKQKARFMMRMTDTLNRVTLAALPDRRDPPVTVGCVTCHRGLAVPATLESTLLATAETHGADSMTKQFRALHGDVASGRWNFSEGALNESARKLATRARTAEALVLLRLNQELHPDSPTIDIQMADVHLLRGEKAEAITRLRAALTKRPNNQQAKRRLQELGETP